MKKLLLLAYALCSAASTLDIQAICRKEKNTCQVGSTCVIPAGKTEGTCVINT